MATSPDSGSQCTVWKRRNSSRLGRLRAVNLIHPGVQRYLREIGLIR